MGGQRICLKPDSIPAKIISTQNSGLREKLQYGDVIMADRGFNIQEMLACKGVNVPPFMNESGQFNERELLETRRIASLRIHIVRSMEQIKNLPHFRLCPNNFMQEWYN